MKTSRTSLGLFAAVIGLLGIIAPVQAVHLQGEIKRIGYQGSSGSAQFSIIEGVWHFRPGCWVPIRVELTNTDNDRFAGRLEVRQRDRDGDMVVGSTAVALQGVEEYTLYVPAGLSERPESFAVRVFDNEDNLVKLYTPTGNEHTEILPRGEIMAARIDSRLILDISEQPVNLLKSRFVQDIQLVHPAVILRADPREVPSNVAGLDMVDVIVWDDPTPSRLDAPQQETLLEWVRRGGLLLMATSKNAAELGRHELFGPVLPARVEELGTLEQLPEPLAELLHGGPFGTELDQPLPVAKLTAADLRPDAEPVIPDKPGPDDQIIMARRPLGRGTIMFLSCTLRELLAIATDTGKNALLRQATLTRRLTRPPEDPDYQGYANRNLFRYIEQATGFLKAVQINLLAAFAFVAVYVLLATGGSWVWLKTRELTQYSWLAFAGMAVLGSAASLGAVQLIRGIGLDTQEVTIVDAQANTYDAVATSYIGLKAATHTEVDLTVPIDWQDLESDESAPTAALRPLPEVPTVFGLDGSNRFTVWERYGVNPQVGQVKKVPLRATLKQFEAQWQGRMTGTVAADLSRVPGNTMLLADDSWVRNDLGVDLHDCYLLIPYRDFQDGWTNRSRFINVLPVPGSDQRLRSGETLSIGKWLDQLTIDRNIPKTSWMQNRQSLNDLQDSWLGRLNIRTDQYGQQQNNQVKVSRNDLQNSLLLLTTFNEVDPTMFQAGAARIERSSGRHLDRSIALTTGTAMFIGFADEPSPVRLCYRRPGASEQKWRRIDPEESTVLYRFAIPIRD